MGDIFDPEYNLSCLTIDSQWLCFLIEKRDQAIKNIFYSWDCWRHKKLLETSLK